MIEVRRDEEGMWSVYDKDGCRIVSYYSRDAAEAVRDMLLDEEEYERSKREETLFARYGGAR